MRYTREGIMKNKDTLIVDAYNIIFNLEEFKSGNFEDSRNDLIDVLIEYKNFSGSNVIVVFDAYKNKNNKPIIENIKGVEVVYTKKHQTADSYIEEYIQKLSRHDIYKVKVATEDRNLLDMVVGYGATRMHPLEFKIEMNMTKKSIKEFTEKPFYNNTLKKYIEEIEINNDNE